MFPRVVQENKSRCLFMNTGYNGAKSTSFTLTFTQCMITVCETGEICKLTYDYCYCAGDSLVIQNGQKFSTMDKGVNKNLASGYSGAWWYHPNSRIVAHSHLTGLYLYGKNNMARKGVNWHHFKGLSYSLKFAEMKIRPFYA